MLEIIAAVAALVSIATLIVVLAVASRQRTVQQQESAALRQASADEARKAREELSSGLSSFSQNIAAQMGSIATAQNGQIDGFAKQLTAFSAANETRMENFRKTLDEQLGRAQEQQRLVATELRQTIEQRLERIQKDNAEKLEAMRKTVDEKLHETLEKRLGESFKLVSERLEAVQRGLGEMQSLASDVGGLKRVLSNVKDRGGWGEFQLEALLEQLLTRDQYAKNISTRPGSREVVEFAIRLPGPRDGGQVWLPIDSKFPLEDYQRLLAAQEAADAAGVEESAKAIEAQIRKEARTIRDKYVEPPHTTDFALLFLPTEGLYAEVLRRPGLADSLQRDFRVTVVGPTTLTALLNSLQMGFRTLAIEKRSSEVWQILGAVKTEFANFGDVLANTKRQLAAVANSIDKAEVRTRQMERKLKGVEALPAGEAQGLLGAEAVEPE